MMMTGNTKTALVALVLVMLGNVSECSLRPHRQRALKKHNGLAANKNNMDYQSPDYISGDQGIQQDTSGDYPVVISGSEDESRSRSTKGVQASSGKGERSEKRSRKKFMNTRRSQTKGSRRRSDKLMKSEQYQEQSESALIISEDEPAGRESPGNGRTSTPAETPDTARTPNYEILQEGKVTKVKIDPFVLEFVLSENTDVPSTENYEDAFETTISFLRVFFHMIYDDALISVEGKRTNAKFSNGHPHLGIAPIVGFLDGAVDVKASEAAAVVRDAFTDTSALQYFVRQLKGMDDPNVFRHTVDVRYLANKDAKTTETVAAVQIPKTGSTGAFVGVALLLSVAIGLKAKKWRELNLV